VTIQWHFQNRPGAGVLQVSGYLAADCAPRFAGAVGWALARGTGPLIVDLKALSGWSPEGQSAISAAVLRLAEQQRPLELAAIPVGEEYGLIADLCDVPVHPDLATALAAHPGDPADQDGSDGSDGSDAFAGPVGAGDVARPIRTDGVRTGRRRSHQNWRSADWTETPV